MISHKIGWASPMECCNIGGFSFQSVLRGHGETTVPRRVAVWSPTRSAVPTTKACVFVRRDGKAAFVTLT